MTKIVFHARGEISTANRALLTLAPLAVTPVTALVFTDRRIRSPDGDYCNTSVLIDGRAFAFTVEMTCTLPFSPACRDVAGADLRGADVTVISAGGRRYAFLTDGAGSLAVMAALPAGSLRVESLSPGGPEPVNGLASGTLIATPFGERPIEELRAGDRVLNADGNESEIRWICGHKVSATETLLYPQLRPLQVPAGHLGGGLPQTGLTLSCQNRLRLDGWRDAGPAPARRRTMAAGSFLGGPVRLSRPGTACTYWQIQLDDLAPVLANGVAAETARPPQRPNLEAGLTLGGEPMLTFPNLARREYVAPAPEVRHAMI